MSIPAGEGGEVSIPAGETPTGDVSVTPPGATATSTISIPPGETTGGGGDGCPTVTVTGELCTTCVVPACLELATATKQCGCPDEVPTVTIDFPCEGGCGGAGCSTQWEIIEPTETCGGDGGDDGGDDDGDWDDDGCDNGDDDDGGDDGGDSGNGGDDGGDNGGSSGGDGDNNGGGSGDGAEGDGGSDGNDNSSDGNEGSGDGPVTAAASRLLPFWAYWL